MPEQISILGLKIDNVSLEQLFDSIKKFINERKAKTLVFINPHIAIEAYKMQALKRYINSASLVVADGIGIVWASRFLGNPIQSKITGTDFMYLISNFCAVNGYSMYFFGAKPGVASEAAENLIKKYPKLKIAGIQHGFIDDDSQIVSDINKNNPDILIVCLGVPKQELWIEENIHKLNVPVVFGNGAAFDFVAGCFKRAPVWMQKFGLEWLFRLLQEPMRLWRRYLIGNMYFILLIVKQKFRILKEN